MKKGTVLSLKKIRLSEFIIKNNVLVLLVLLVAAVAFAEGDAKISPHATASHMFLPT